MESIYIFTSENFLLVHRDKEYVINKNCVLKITNYKNDDFILIYNKASNHELKINLACQTSTNYYNVYTCEQTKFIEILTTNYCNLLCKQSQPNAEAFVYENAVRLIFDGQCFCCGFVGDNESHLINSNGKILIFNKNNLLEFNVENKIFNKLNIEKYVKNNKKIEVLCKIPHNIDYFLYFHINLLENSFTKEKYKTTQNLNQKQENNIIYNFFYLAKYGLQDGKKYLKDENIFENCHKYFTTFKTLLLCNNEYFGVANNFVQKITFKVENNKIIDID